jgi:hypothetical protein
MTEGGSTSQTHTTAMTDARTTGYDTSNTDTFGSSTGRAVTNRVDFGATDSAGYNWSVNHEDVHDFSKEAGGGGGGSLFGLIDLHADGKVGWVDGTRDGSTMGGNMSSSVSGSAGTSATTSAQQNEAHSRSEGYHWDRTQSYTEANSFSTSRMWETTKSYGESRTESQVLTQRLNVSDSELYSVSTTQSTTLQTHGHVYAGQFGVWYRQTSRLVRRGTVIAYDLCGNGSPVGVVTIDDWTWAPDLAIANTCPPPSNLPVASCRIQPCGGP